MKKKIVSHKVIERTYEYGYGDCYLYRIRCSCGKESGGWTPSQAEEDRKKHLMEARTL